MGNRCRIAVGIDTRIVCRELLHLVETVIDRVELLHVAKMPLAGEVGRLPVLLVEFSDGRRVRGQAVRVAGNNHDRQCRANRDPPGHERGAARRAARLTVPAREHRAFPGHAINVRRRMPKRRTAEVHTVVAPANVVAHEHDDVGFLLRCHRTCRQRHNHNQYKQR